MKLRRYYSDIIGISYKVYYILGSLNRVNNIRSVVGKVVSKRRNNGILYICLLVRYGKDYVKLSFSTISPYLLFLEVV
ncbi:hypothetical protein [Candidatus Vidania fulgoroideorum]